MAQGDRCEVCNSTYQFHLDNPQLSHEYVGTGGPATAEGLPTSEARSSGREAGGGSGDAVLRLALLKAGVLTELDLAEAEAWIATVNGRNCVLSVVPDPGHPGKLCYKLDTLEGLVQQVATQ